MRAILAAAMLMAGPAAAQTLVARQDTTGCTSERAARALANPSEPRRADPGWIAFVQHDGGCVRITPNSRWMLEGELGDVVRLRNLVPGTGAELFVPATDMQQTVGSDDSPPGLAAGNGAKFCIDADSTMLLVAPAGSGDLEFGLESWSGHGHLFSETGRAHRRGTGWTYPAAGCTIHLARRRDGGYDAWVSGGECSDQGFSPAPDQRMAFPASSRRGSIPPGKSIAAAMSIESGGESCR